MAAKPKVTDEQFIEAYMASHGSYADTANYIQQMFEVPFTRQAAMKRAKQFPNLKRDVMELMENDFDDHLLTANDTLTNGHSNLFVANSFTPSIQGMNQTFKPDIVCTAPSNYFLKIYDRWGVMLFESDDPTIGWDGTYKGKPQPLGTYVYYLQVNCGICTYANKGDLTLIR